MKFVLTRLTGMVELLFMLTNEILYENNSQNEICSSYKEIVFLLKTWLKPSDSFGFMFSYYYLFFYILKCQSLG